METNRTRGKRSSGRIRLFSYGGKAVQRKATNAETGKEATGTGKADNSAKIIDYSTLLSWYNEQNAAKVVAEGSGTAYEYNKKQKNLKFIML